MADKINKIKLNSTGRTKPTKKHPEGKKTGYFRTTTKNKKKAEKLKLKCFDPRAYNEEASKKAGKDRYGMHVEFVEGKI